MISEALPKKDVSKMEKHVFRVYDTNGDGVIDFVEFMVVFHILSGEEQSSGSVWAALWNRNFFYGSGYNF